MRNFKFTFETDSQEEATMFLKTIQSYEENGSVLSPMPQRATEPPPPMPQRATEPPPPMPQNFDVKKIRAEIGDELTRIVNGGNEARSYLTDNGYSGINKIPGDRLVSFLNMLKDEHVNG